MGARQNGLVSQQNSAPLDKKVKGRKLKSWPGLSQILLVSLLPGVLAFYFIF